MSKDQLMSAFGFLIFAMSAWTVSKVYEISLVVSSLKAIPEIVKEHEARLVKSERESYFVIQTMKATGTWIGE